MLFEGMLADKRVQEVLRGLLFIRTGEGVKTGNKEGLNPRLSSLGE